MAHTHKFDPAHIARLEDPERRRLLPPGPVLEAVPLGPGQTLADIGCGVGYWTFAYLEASPDDARFVCVDSEPAMLAALERRLEDRGLGGGRVRLVRSSETRIPVEDGVADVAVLGHVYHELADRRAMLGEVLRILKPRGRLAVVDWAVLPPGAPAEHGPPNEHRVPAEVARRELAEAGFRGIEPIPGYGGMWAFRAERPG